MIEVENLTKYYGTWPACRDITFNVEQGEILGFLGPNGAGKTTTMRMITGYLPPTSGTARVAGYDVVDKSLDARKHLGYLPETVPLYTDLTPFEYLDFRGRICGLHNGRERKARIYEVMEELNLVDVSNKLIGQLSRGYRQRVGLAQALLHNPEALILDEPTVGLDPIQITEVRNLIKDLGKNHTIILSTHLLPEVSMVCNRVVIINRGRLVALDTPIHLMEGQAQGHLLEVEVDGRPAAVVQTLRSIKGVIKATVGGGQPGAPSPDGIGAEAPAQAFESMPAGAYTYQIEGAEKGPDLRPLVAAALVGAGHGLLELKSLRLSLEDVFLRIISQNAEEEPVYDEGEEGDLEYGPDGGVTEDYAEPEEEAVAAAPAQSVRVKAKRVRK